MSVYLLLLNKGKRNISEINEQIDRQLYDKVHILRKKHRKTIWNLREKCVKIRG